MDSLDVQQYLTLLKKRVETAEKSDVVIQATRHQQDAVETAELFDDIKSIGVYMRLFKQYRSRRNELLACRDWVIQKSIVNKGRMFIASYQTFLKLKPKENPRT